MILKYTEKRVRLGRKEYTVIIPHGIDGVVNNENCIDADRKGLNALLMSLYLMIEDKKRIIYFPLWNNKVADKNMYRKPLTENRYQNFDMVMLSHTLQFPIHDWKELRAKLRKVKGHPHSKEIVLSQAEEKMNRICQKHEKTDTYFKKLDEIDPYFRFDTHFLVGGPYSFATFFLRLHEMLAEPLEHRLSTWHWLPWMAIPQRRSDKNDWLELGFYDRTYRKDNDKAPW